MDIDQPNRNTTPKPIRIPPIDTIDINKADITSLMKSCLVPQDLTTVDHFTSVTTKLGLMRKQFYTHDIQSHKADKFVLKGFHDIDVGE